MIDLMVKEAFEYIDDGYHVREAIDMAIANHVTANAYPIWIFGRIESKVFDRMSAHAA